LLIHLFFRMRNYWTTLRIILLICFSGGAITILPEPSWRKMLQGNDLAKIVPWILIVGGSYELYLQLRDLYQNSATPKMDDYLSDLSLCEFYRKKRAFLDKMTSLQSTENHKVYLELLQRDTEIIAQQAKGIREESRQRTQKINEEYEDTANKVLETKRQIRDLRRKLGARFGESA